MDEQEPEYEPESLDDQDMMLWQEYVANLDLRDNQGPDKDVRVIF